MYKTTTNPAPLLPSDESIWNQHGRNLIAALTDRSIDVQEALTTWPAELLHAHLADDPRVLCLSGRMLENVRAHVIAEIARKPQPIQKSAPAAPKQEPAAVSEGV